MQAQNPPQTPPNPQIPLPVLKVIRYYTDLVSLYYSRSRDSEEKVNKVIRRLLRCDNGNIVIDVTTVDDSIMLSVNINNTSHIIKIHRDPSFAVFAKYSDDSDNIESYSCYGVDCIKAALRWVKRAFSQLLDGVGPYPPLPEDIHITFKYSYTRNNKGFIHIFALLPFEHHISSMSPSEQYHRFHLFSIDPWGNVVFYPQLSHFHKYSFILNTAKVLL